MKLHALASNACCMKEVEEIYQAEWLVQAGNPFNGFAESTSERGKETDATELFRSTHSYIQAKKEVPDQSMMERTINNYLKSPEEIEAEFRFMICCFKEDLNEKQNPSDTYNRIVKRTENSYYIHSNDIVLPGPMEENY